MKNTGRFFLRTLLGVFILANIIIAFHAYKFTHYYDAGDSAVKAKENKTGWDKTKDILFGINAAKRPDTAPADTAFQTIYFTTQDNTKLEAWYFPAGTMAKGTVALFHGHGSNKSGVIIEAMAFKKLGYNTLLLDFRAHGNSGGNTTTIGFREVEDVKLVYDYIQNKGEKNIILWGISMGAAAISKTINDFGLQPSKIILEMPFGALQEAAAGRIKMMGLPPQPLAFMLTFWGGVECGFWAYNLKPSNYVKAIKCPVLLQWGKLDTRVSEKETTDIYTNISSPKKLVVYQNSGHQSLCNNETELWTKEVSQFLAQ